jgi:ferredoxin
MITFQVRDTTGELRTIEVPEDINLNLMEVLKASEYPIEAICGGMALCATCHVSVIEGWGQLSKPQDVELDTLDTIPNATSSSRLSCQIKINAALNNTLFELKNRG